jgi:outer membrane protein assembly factor BamB
MDDDASVTPAYMSPYVYAASRRGTVYCLAETNGAVVWTFAGEHSISHPIMTIDGALYVISEKGEMFRLDPRTGYQMWYQRGILRFASAGNGRLYVVDAYGRLAVLDAATGARLGAIPIGEVGVVVANMESDRIYLATPTGMLQGLHEMALAKPLAHAPGFAIPPPPKEGAPADGAAPATTPDAPAGGTPAAGAPANPFGT